MRVRESLSSRTSVIFGWVFYALLMVFITAFYYSGE